MSGRQARGALVVGDLNYCSSLSGSTELSLLLEIRAFPKKKAFCSFGGEEDPTGMDCIFIGVK